jgi:hypothetical protein
MNPTIKKLAMKLHDIAWPSSDSTSIGAFGSYNSFWTLFVSHFLHIYLMGALYDVVISLFYFLYDITGLQINRYTRL